MTEVHPGIGPFVAVTRAVLSNKRILAVLVSQKGTASTELAQALAEFKQSVEAFRDPIREFYALRDLDPHFPGFWKAIRDRAQGDLLPDIQSAKGSCREIGRIYHTYLRGWFDVVLKRRRSSERVRHMFVLMADMDEGVCRAAEVLAREIRAVARKALQLKEQGKPEQVRCLISESATRLDPLIDTINTTLASMIELEQRFRHNGKPESTTRGLDG